MSNSATNQVYTITVSGDIIGGNILNNGVLRDVGTNNTYNITCAGLIRGGANGYTITNGSSTSTINITGNVLGSSTANTNAVTTTAGGTINITGSATAGTAGSCVLNSNGTIRLTRAIGNGYGVTTTEDIRVSNDSGAQFTLYNDVNRACTVNWIAIGT